MKLHSLIFLMVFIVGCSSGDDSPQTDPQNIGLLGTVWELSHYTADTGSVVAVAEETKYQVFLAVASSDVRAFIGCKNYSDSYYELNDGYLTIRLGASNDGECITDSAEFATQTIAIGSLLEGGGTGESVPLMYSVFDGQLTLEAADGRVLEFIQVAELLLGR